MRQYKYEDNEARFWRKVEKLDGCWLWRGTIRIKNQGYGAFHVRVGVNKRYRMEYAHRYAFLLAHGRAPNGGLRHCCDTPACVNPAHLTEGTQADNIRDRDTRGRTARGERNGNAKLSDAQRKAVFVLRTEGLTQKQIAQRFGVSRPCISHVLARDTVG